MKSSWSSGPTSQTSVCTNWDETTGTEDMGVRFRALWKPLADLARESDPLYPDGLLALIANP
jgi:hypothetical protein